MTVQLEPVVDLINAGHYEKAVLAVRSAKADTIPSSDSLLWTKFFMLEAVACFEGGQFQEAYQAVLQLFDPLLFFAPVWLEPYVVDILLLCKDPDRALRYIERHLAHNAPNMDGLHLKARVLFGSKKYIQARDALTDACRLAPGLADLSTLLAECYRCCGQYGRAMRAAQRAWEQGAAIAIVQMIRLVFVRKGSCNACRGQALCCKSKRLADGSNVVQSKWQYDSLLWSDERLKVWKPVSSNADGDWIFNCSLLSPQGKCTRYRMRPRVCRKFPEDPIAAHKHPACSYRFEIRKGAPRFSHPGAFKAVCRELKENGCRDELAVLENYYHS